MRLFFVSCIILWVGRMLLPAQERSFVSPACIAGSYELDYNSHTTTDMSGISANNEASSPRQQTDITLKGSLRILLSSPYKAVCIFDSLRILYTVNDVPQSTLSARVEEELRLPIVALYDSTHALAQILFDSTTSPQSRNLAASLIALPQFTTTQKEKDRTGSYTVECTQHLYRSPQRQIVKIKQGYSPQQQKRSLRRITTEQQATLQGRQESLFYELGEYTLRSCWGRDTQQVMLGGIAIARNTCEYSFKSKSAFINQATPSLSEHLLVSPVVMSIPEGEDEARTKRAALESTFGASSLRGILDSLDSFTPGDTSLAALLPRKMCAMLGLIAGSGDSLMQRLSSYTPDDPRISFIADALTRDGSPYHQQLYLRLLNIQRSHSSVMPALIANFIHLQQPEPASERWLYDYAFSDTAAFARSTAQLALGAMAAAISVLDSLRADSLLRRILLHRNEMRPKQLLYILGNSGLPSALAVIEQYLGHSDSELQMLALYSMRFIPSERVDSLLLRSLQKGDTLMQSTALKTLMFRVPLASTIESVCSVCSSKAPYHLRTEALNTLRRWIQYDRSLLPRLRLLLPLSSVQNDVRDMAQELLKETAP